jgi:hypothetical protein
VVLDEPIDERVQKAHIVHVFQLRRERAFLLDVVPKSVIALRINRAAEDGRRRALVYPLRTQ